MFYAGLLTVTLLDSALASAIEMYTLVETMRLTSDIIPTRLPASSSGQAHHDAINKSVLMAHFIVAQ